MAVGQPPSLQPRGHLDSRLLVWRPGGRKRGGFGHGAWGLGAQGRGRHAQRHEPGSRLLVWRPGDDTGSAGQPLPQPMGRPNSHLWVRRPESVNGGAARTPGSSVQCEHRKGHEEDGGTKEGGTAAAGHTQCSPRPQALLLPTTGSAALNGGHPGAFLA